MTYDLPVRFDDDHLDFIANDLERLKEEADLVLDFSKVRFVYPFATLTIAVALIDVLEARRAKGLPAAKLTGTLSTGAGYLMHFGFFKALGFRVGNAPGEAPGGISYLPITVLNKDELEIAAQLERIQAAVDRESDRLARVIFPAPDNGAAASMLSFCLREMIRNTFEHGEAAACVAMAQRWADGDAELAIADRGIGVHAALRTAHESASAEESLRKAILPGITSGANRATGSKWDNTGFGLYIASELGKRYGGFALASSGGLLRIDMVDSYERLPVPGTIVKLRVSTSDAPLFDYILHEIVQEGEKRALQIPGAIKSASKTSKSLNI